MKPMLPSLTFDPPIRPEWLYEVKYDGFRALLEWENDHLQLISRNGKSLLPQFPEIQEFLERNAKLFLPFLPLQLDGELVVLENRFKANFSAIQGRGRLKSEKKIQEQATITPCHLLVFDILKIQGRDLLSVPYIKRKEELSKLFNAVHFNRNPDTSSLQLLQCIEPYTDFQEIWRNVVLYDGEGIIAKQKTSLWKEGKRSEDWLKYKNWKYVSCFITEMDKTNHYFGVGVFKEKDVYRLGKILFGLKPEEKQILSQTLKHNKQNEDAQFIYVEPAICLEVKYLEVFENELREPYFDRFRFDLSVEDCSFDQFMLQQKNLPTDLEITHPDKALWTEKDIKKSSYIHYLREISPQILPFLSNRALTVIRYPHGIHGEAFYQKNCPDYAPDFVQTYTDNGIDFILCNNVETLIWLGNQLAIEFHIPFQTIRYSGPEEIIFDLDPPSKD
ncbi:MAG: DNA ligase D, partial [Bacillota bacterium]|nr:DNA ligase D [Bacillota bacterium]